MQPPKNYVSNKKTRNLPMVKFKLSSGPGPPSGSTNTGGGDVSDVSDLKLCLQSRNSSQRPSLRAQSQGAAYAGAKFSGDNPMNNGEQSLKPFYVCPNVPSRAVNLLLARPSSSPQGQGTGFRRGRRRAGAAEMFSGDDPTNKTDPSSLICNVSKSTVSTSDFALSSQRCSTGLKVQSVRSLRLTANS